MIAKAKNRIYRSLRMAKRYYFWLLILAATVVTLYLSLRFEISTMLIYMGAVAVPLIVRPLWLAYKANSLDQTKKRQCRIL